ncbi:tyrosine-type recombinase/integrase [Pseudonocardia sp. H11422]|uniref:tyrosine-type recombinase/integrase n=1 Tax=Pseudonocardia sp. H11422 TaxID=2835866 RepID=UPI001BDC5525|nr:tyrosine-type recombinase/integrase [Pseudonocardia sp. H11422]
MPRSGSRRKRLRGGIEKLPSGALRVSVYAGTDPISGRRLDLRETIPPGPNAQAEAEKAARRLAAQIDERRHPTTNATLDQLLDRYLETLDVAETTRRMYAKYAEKHIRSFVGRLKAGAVDVETLDSLYAELRRCRSHCDRSRGLVDHRTPREHECDDRCRPHRCRGLSSTTIRHIHFVLRGAFEKGVRWRWVSQNPVQLVDAPRAKAPDPRPPTPEEAARIVEEAWQDPDWGTLVWLTMTTGARRGELCGLRWSHVDLTNGVLAIRRAIAQHGTERFEKETKTRQQRRVALDPETVKALTEHFERAAARCEALGVALARDAFVFSLAPDSSRPLVPSSVSQRYSRLAKRLGIETHLHCLRHYSATELIAAGVDVRTVAGRLGHSGGGVTTLRVYAAWLAEADQRASASLAQRGPARPTTPVDEAERALRRPRSPRERLAVELREKILNGDYLAGSHLPGVKTLAADRDLSPSTVKRTFELLREWGLISGAEGERARVRTSARPLGGDGTAGAAAQ